MNVSTGLDFQDLLWRNTLGSREYIYNVLNLFETNPRLGLAVPPSPAHGQYTWVLGNGWSGNFTIVRDLARRLSLTVSIQEEDFPIASGSAFWCRKKALELLWNYPWKYDDFPEEPMAPDHEISHAIERIFPFVAQQAGYYSAWIMTPRDAMLESRNMRYIVDTMLYHLKFDLDRFPGLLLGGVEDINGLTKRMLLKFFTAVTGKKMDSSCELVEDRDIVGALDFAEAGELTLYLKGWFLGKRKELQEGERVVLVGNNVYTPLNIPRHDIVVNAKELEQFIPVDRKVGFQFRIKINETYLSEPIFVGYKIDKKIYCVRISKRS